MHRSREPQNFYDKKATILFFYQRIPKKLFKRQIIIGGKIIHPSWEDLVYFSQRRILIFGDNKVTELLAFTIIRTNRRNRKNIFFVPPENSSASLSRKSIVQKTIFVINQSWGKNYKRKFYKVSLTCETSFLFSELFVRVPIFLHPAPILCFFNIQVKCGKIPILQNKNNLKLIQ